MLLKINNVDITNIKQATTLLKQLTKTSTDKDITITVCQDDKQSMHHEEGIPIMYFDQLHTIAKHLHNIQHSRMPTLRSTSSTSKINAILNNLQGIFPKNKRRSTKLTRK